MNKAVLNVDLGFGDQGKGTTVEYQTKQTKSLLTVRFNGGAQAAHNIVLSDGRHHTFSSFGSTMFESGVKTFLSKYMLVNPLAMMIEEEHLRSKNVHDAFNRTFIDGDALMTTPYHRADNRIKELFRGNKMHGSCGMGISATVEDSLARPDECIRMKDLLDDKEFKRKLWLNRLAMIDSCQPYYLPGNPLMDTEASTFDEEVFEFLLEEYKIFRSKVTILKWDDAAEQLFVPTETVVFEPAQGVLLDENFGFHPFTTWTTCTLKNADSILTALNYKGSVDRFGVLRTFATRHGPGPMVTENKELTTVLADPYNTLNIWQKGFRCGWLDLVSLDYALRCNGKVDGLSVTHVDWLLNKKTHWDVCTKYILDGQEWTPFIPANMDDQIKLTSELYRVVPHYETYAKDDILSLIASKLKTEIKLISSGPKYEDKTWIGATKL